jgi:S-formylglutathione hydrolase FrmB
MIVVLPDSKTCTTADYSSSATTEISRYIARDVVAYMNAHYRTIPKDERGLVGHSMGGYGATGSA